MSTSDPSTEAAEPPTTCPSLAELRARLLADAAVPETRRRDMASALNSLARALGRPPETIPADPVVLRPLLAGVTPAMAGMRPGRWRNVLSLTAAGMAHAGIVVVQGRIRDRPSPAWEAVLALLEPGAHRHFALWRFARYATLNGVEPGAVDDAAVAAFGRDLERRSLVADPARAARDVALLWNAEADAHAGWPQRRLLVPDNRRRYAFPLDSYPETLRRDVDAWAAWLGGDDPFLERDFAPLKPASLANRLRLLRLYLAALVHQGADPRDLVDLAAVVTPARAQSGLTFFWSRANRRPSLHCHQVAALVVMIARHWAKLPQADVDRLRGMANRLRPADAGLTGRNMARLRQVEDPARLEALLALPGRLLREARAAGPPGPQVARQVQAAVAIEILLHIPMRLRNLRELRIGSELLPGPGGSLAISVPGPAVKNGVAIEARLAGEAAALVAAYIRTYRPRLPGAGGAWLFPGERADAPKCEDALRGLVQKAIADRCGLRFHPHLFRHLAAWLVLRENPAAHGQVQRLLGHKSVASTMQFYSGLETLAARDHYDRLLEDLRGGPGTAATAARPPRRAASAAGRRP